MCRAGRQMRRVQRRRIDLSATTELCHTLTALKNPDCETLFITQDASIAPAVKKPVPAILKACGAVFQALRRGRRAAAGLTSASLIASPGPVYPLTYWAPANSPSASLRGESRRSMRGPMTKSRANALDDVLYLRISIAASAPIHSGTPEHA